MSLSRDSRQERKLKAVRRAQFRLKQNLERIDWEEDSLLPEIEALKSGKSVLGLPDGMAFDIVIEHEVQNPSEAAKPDTDA
jgi:hypothetical protein